MKTIPKIATVKDIQRGARTGCHADIRCWANAVFLKFSAKLPRPLEVAITVFLFRVKNLRFADLMDTSDTAAVAPIGEIIVLAEDLDIDDDAISVASEELEISISDKLGT